jgi:tetratricopeptide (TPR) repeat protein
MQRAECGGQRAGDTTKRLGNFSSNTAPIIRAQRAGVFFALAWLFVLFSALPAFAQVADLGQLRTRIEQGDYLSAIPRLEAHIRSRPSDADAYFLLSRALYLSGGAVNVSRSEDAINQCFRLSSLPKAEHYWQRGLVRASSRIKDALLDLRLAAFGNARATPKELFRYAMDWGAVAWRSGDLGQALEAYRRAAKLDANQPLAWLHQGTLLVAQGNPSEADSALSKAIVLMQSPKPHPSLPEAFYWRGRAMELLGKPDAAKENYRRALEFNPNHSGAKAALEALR